MSIFRDIGESLGNTVLENVGRAMGRAQERTPLPVDLLESDDAYLAVFDAPGAQNTDVQVQYRDGTVEVRIDRFRGFHEGFEMRYPGRGLALDGHVDLPDDAMVDAEAATATLQPNGSLHVRVPKVDSEHATTEDEVAVEDGAPDGSDEGDAESDDADEEHADDVDDSDGD
jgi:HSP20 family molecular chaperone IbpA